MELAGLSCAQVVTKVYPASTHPRVLVVAGPGNNGGDALVAARHLTHFGYTARVLYPKRPQQPLFVGLVTQLRHLGVPFVDDASVEVVAGSDVILDGIFGFSFSGDVRAPFDGIIKSLREAKAPIISIDIPSGWDVEKGNVTGDGLEPEALISLTAPKLCARFFNGAYHYVGGRFVPRQMEKELGLKIPAYQDTDQCVVIPKGMEL
ncbi:NAD(P)H-hydrate epimerase [Irineochytrium annulatum]|nr:NAD(P)H-hydrate epimerase [Irineochytrium annulatum]